VSRCKGGFLFSAAEHGACAAPGGAILKPKLFALDLDGTLLDREGRVHASDLEAVRELRQAGVVVTIVTGRLYSGSREAARAAGMSTPIACLDGGQIVHSGSEQELFHQSLRGDDAERLRGAMRLHGAACFLLAGDEIVHDEQGDPYISYVRTWSPRVIRHDEATDHPHWGHERGVSQVVCVGPKQVVEATMAEVQQRLGAAAFAVAFPVGRPMLREGDEQTWGMVVRARGSSKGTAVQFLADHHGIDIEEVVAVGDWLNDVPMFQVAGRSFAMGQAPDEVKSHATDVLEATAATGGGVAEAARRLGLIR
jgi:hydroxymethylpyrimidine pyrophosphatase-like HAD family hydrolase